MFVNVTIIISHSTLNCIVNNDMKRKSMFKKKQEDHSGPVSLPY